jgi:hypothetical protein
MLAVYGGLDDSDLEQVAIEQPRELESLSGTAPVFHRVGDDLAQEQQRALPPRPTDACTLERLLQPATRL